MKSININSLWPNFEGLWKYLVALYQDQPTEFSSDILSAAIVAFLLIVFIFSITVTLVRCITARYKVHLINKLIKNINAENLYQERRNLREEAIKLKLKYVSSHVGNLWLEFDETLIESASRKNLYNTIDSDHFFNTRTLAPLLTENRLLAAVPGSLTAIGVIGTFAGLQMGLDGISFDGGVTQQQQDIQNVIASAAIAFLTSVWGVLTSVIFNFLEKFLEQGVKGKVSKLQDRIDFLFPRINPEQSLIDIAASSKKSEDALNGLAEKIGEQLQQAVTGIGNQVTKGIREVMNPAINGLIAASKELTEKQANSATDALSQLIEQFIEKISEAGEGQRQMMQEATSGLNTSINDLHEKMNGFLSQMENQSSKNKELEEQNRAKLIEELERFSEKMSGVVTDNISSSRQASEQNEIVVVELQRLTEKISGLITGLGTYLQSMVDASNNMNQAGDKVSSAANLLENEINRAVKAVTDLSTENSRILTNTNDVLKNINELKDKLKEVIDNVIKASVSISNTFNQLDEKQEQFLSKQEKTLTQFKNHITQEFETLVDETNNFLTSYTESVRTQTNSRLDGWNQQTAEFCRQMTTTVQMLHNALEELENRNNN